MSKSIFIVSNIPEVMVNPETTPEIRVYVEASGLLKVTVRKGGPQIVILYNSFSARGNINPALQIPSPVKHVALNYIY